MSPRHWLASNTAGGPVGPACGSADDAGRRMEGAIAEDEFP